MAILSSFFTRGPLYLLGCLILFLSLGTGAKAQFPLNLSESHASVQTLSFTDLNLQDFRSTAWLFTLNFRFDPQRTTLLPVKLEGAVDFTLADGRSFNRAITFRTRGFEVLPGGLTITNLDIGAETQIPTEQFNYRDEARRAIEDIALSTQQLPAGRYVIDLVAVDLSDPPRTLSNSVRIELVIEDYSRTTLVWPADGSYIPEFSMLQWMTNAPRVRLRIGEIPPGTSREEALSRSPLHVDQVLSERTSFQIASGVGVQRPFQTGVRYAWTVESVRRGSGGQEIFERGEVWEFTIEGASQSRHEGTMQQIDQLLNGRFQSVLDQIRNQNLSATNRIVVDSAVLSEAELQLLLNFLMQNQENIINVSIE